MLIEPQTVARQFPNHDAAVADAARAVGAAENGCVATALAAMPEFTDTASFSIWDQRLARFETVSRQYERERNRRDQIRRAADKAAPKPVDIRCYGGIRGILNDRFIGADEQLRRIAMWEEWEPRHKDALFDAGWRPADQAYVESTDDDVVDTLLDAEGELMSTPVPTVEALGVKLTRLLADEVGVLVGDDLASPRFLAAALASDNYNERMLAVCLQDALRLAGVDDDRAQVKPFDPQHLSDLAASEGFALEVSNAASTNRSTVALVNVSAPENAIPSDDLSKAVTDLMPIERRALRARLER